MESVKNEFLGFEGGFEGFPKHLPDDCVEYTLFVIDTKLNSQKELLARLEAVRKESKKLTDKLLKDHIWQRDGFGLEVERGKEMMHLRGLTDYGDSVEDEWLIVYILKELSKQFPDLWIKTVDTDGEFLLIEAANALPPWLNPEIADNRVWIHNSALRIIPLSTDLASSKQTTPVSRSLRLEEALEIISSTPETLIHSPLIEAEAFYRLRDYPSQITASLHHAAITLPRKLAYILHNRPTSIAPAVEAFYLRDPIALKTLRTASSDLIFPPEDLVTISTRFTKVLYAQLKAQQFSTPSAWKNIIAESENDPTLESPASKRYAQLEMGMKVTSGFEMLLRDSKNKDRRMVREVKIMLDDLAADENTGLPTDEDITKWKDVNREDDENWLDINFQDFEKKLQGKDQSKQSSEIPGEFGPDRPPGFGDAKTEADLEKMVERFEAFLNDESAEGAEPDDMDIDDEDTDGDSEEEDKEVSFDENEFARMMREMMGLPSGKPEETVDTPQIRQSRKLGKSRIIEEIGNDKDDDEEGEEEEAKIREVMRSMEAELNEEGTLNLEPTPQKPTALKGYIHLDQENDPMKAQNVEEGFGTDEELDVDFNLAKNLLESFKSQTGLQGPAGNLMGIMGLQLPRDEDDTTPAVERP